MSDVHVYTPHMKVLYVEKFLPLHVLYKLEWIDAF